MNEINFTIVDGEPPFEVELLGSNLPKQIVNTIGQHTIQNVPNGVYNLRITDSNDCVYEENIIVNPSVTTTTTTVLPGNSIIAGLSQDPLGIFNTQSTNRDSSFTGYPDPNTITLYLWFKTLDGKKFNDVKTFDYSIDVSGLTGNSTFEFISLSDAINSEVQETTIGPTKPLNGSIILNNNFIETYFEFIYYKDNVNPRFQISLESPNQIFSTNTLTKFDENKQFGIIDINRFQIDFSY